MSATSEPLRPDRPIAAYERAAATTALAGGAVWATSLLALHIVEPEFDPTWRFISEYALGQAGWLMTIAFVALAVSLLATVVAVARHTRTVTGRLGLFIIVVGALGLLLAATFETDPVTTPSNAYTFSGRMHILGASLDYSPVGMLLVSWSLSRTSRWRAARRRLMISAGLTAALTIALMATLPYDGQFGPGVWAGFVGRLLHLSYVGWTITVAHAVMRSTGVATPAQPTTAREQREAASS